MHFIGAKDLHFVLSLWGRANAGSSPNTRIQNDVVVQGRDPEA